jgi:hypothetical protein
MEGVSLYLWLRTRNSTAMFCKLPSFVQNSHTAAWGKQLTRQGNIKTKKALELQVGYGQSKQPRCTYQQWKDLKSAPTAFEEVVLFHRITKPLEPT